MFTHQECLKQRGELDDWRRSSANKIIDLHLYPNDGSCCLGIFSKREDETLSEFVINKVFPYFVWQAYYEKFEKIPPCGEYSHDRQGVREFVR